MNEQLNNNLRRFEAELENMLTWYDKDPNKWTKKQRKAVRSQQEKIEELRNLLKREERINNEMKLDPTILGSKEE